MRKRGRVKLTTMLELQDRGKNLGIEASVPVGAGVRRRIFGVSNVITGR